MLGWVVCNDGKGATRRVNMNEVRIMERLENGTTRLTFDHQHAITVVEDPEALLAQLRSSRQAAPLA